MPWFDSMLIRFLSSPRKVALVCLMGLILGLGLEGTLWRLWLLSGQRSKMAQELLDLRQEKLRLENRIKLAQSPEFLAREALQRFDLVSKDQLVFVFSLDDGND